MTRSVSITIPAAVRRAIVAHARRERPRECCGLLVGWGREIVFAVSMDNVAAGATAYRIDDRAHVSLRRTIRAFTPALTIQGVYHSHPRGAAVPSATDRALAFYPDWVHVIVGFAGRTARLRAFRIRQGRVRALGIR